jgi:hypothetical protein
MQHQFKAGDLALIKRCVTWPEAVGRSVELLERAEPMSEITYRGRLYFNTSDCAGWMVAHDDGFPVHSVFGLLTETRRPVALFLERNLMPLKGDQSPTQTNTETPKEVVHG